MKEKLKEIIEINRNRIRTEERSLMLEDEDKRYKAEMEIISSNNYEDIYYLAYLIAEKARKDNKIILLRGTAGSSYISYLVGINYINPLDYDLDFEIFTGVNGEKTPYFEINCEPNYVNRIKQYLAKILKGAEFSNMNLVSGEIPIIDGRAIYKCVIERKCNNITQNIIHISGLEKIALLEKIEQVTKVAHTSICEYESILKSIKEGKVKENEFNLDNVKQIISKVNPITISDYVQIYAMQHGRNIWENNIETLIESNNIQEMPCSRDDIFKKLVNKGIDKKIAYKIMEEVRKGRASTNKYITVWNELVTIMKQHNIEEWYIKSLGKIKYAFPKAHSYNFTFIHLWLAWYEINYPNEFKRAYKKHKIYKTNNFNVIYLF